MSTTTEAIDTRAYLNGWLSALTGMITADINAIPDDKWTATFGGCTRPANALVADAVSTLLWTTGALNGNAPSDPEGAAMKQLTADFENKGVAIARIAEAAEEFKTALTGASDETLNSTVPAPWGMPTPVLTIAHIAVSHIWYHDGQLNYIQCLLGDDKIHWMG
ncbi:MAG TPA: DinB family protein [Fimbriimonadaceae bacterium]|nr:DinB family protein [Fimbriimonadaceae bacterium]